jgi:hypothetical protein
MNVQTLLIIVAGDAPPEIPCALATCGRTVSANIVRGAKRRADLRNCGARRAKEGLTKHRGFERAVVWGFMGYLS